MQLPFGQCPNKPGDNFRGASLSFFAVAVFSSALLFAKQTNKNMFSLESEPAMASSGKQIELAGDNNREATEL